jgi:hypothetical protein
LGHWNPAIVVIGHRHAGRQWSQQNGGDQYHPFHASCSSARSQDLLLNPLPDSDLKAQRLLLQINVRFFSSINI